MKPYKQHPFSEVFKYQIIHKLFLYIIYDLYIIYMYDFLLNAG